MSLHALQACSAWPWLLARLSQYGQAPRNSQLTALSEGKRNHRITVTGANNSASSDPDLTSTQGSSNRRSCILAAPEGPLRCLVYDCTCEQACVASIIHQWFPCIYQTIAAKDTVHWLAARLLVGTNRSDGRFSSIQCFRSTVRGSRIQLFRCLRNSISIWRPFRPFSNGKFEKRRIFYSMYPFNSEGLNLTQL